MEFPSPGEASLSFHDIGASDLNEEVLGFSGDFGTL